MFERKRKGFTLVELLVVISIISMLMALVLPAVQNAKESARTIQCSNNLHQLSMGALLYNKTYQRFPGYRNHLRPGPKVTTWAVSVFPYIGQGRIYEEWSKRGVLDTVGNAEVPMVHVEMLVCPSNPPRAGEKTPTDYVCNAGYAKQADNDTSGNSFDLYYDSRSDTGSRPGPRNGVFLDHGKYADEATPIMTLAYLNAKDGSSKTLMLSENVLASTWTHWTRQQDFGTYENYVPKHFMSFVWHQFITDDHRERQINGKMEKPAMTNAQADLNYARPSSYHPQGVNVTFCDGHNRFLNESIDYNVYIQLMTPHGLESFSVGECPIREALDESLY